MVGIEPTFREFLSPQKPLSRSRIPVSPHHKKKWRPDATQAGRTRRCPEGPRLRILNRVSPVGWESNPISGWCKSTPVYRLTYLHSFPRRSKNFALVHFPVTGEAAGAKGVAKAAPAAFLSKPMR